MLGALRRGRGTWQGEEHAKGDGEAESISGLTLFASLLGVPPHQPVMQSWGLLHRAASPPGTAEVSGRSGGDALSQRRHQLMEQIKGLVVIYFFFPQDNQDINVLNSSLAR